MSCYRHLRGALVCSSFVATAIHSTLILRAPASSKKLADTWKTSLKSEPVKLQRQSLFLINLKHDFAVIISCGNKNYHSVITNAQPAHLTSHNILTHRLTASKGTAIDRLIAVNSQFLIFFKRCIFSQLIKRQNKGSLTCRIC